ncbi:phosphate acyltransferase [Caldimicrobium thiodismutans]|uniref:Phosphate acyltransferase n=1 Tax=Caldimicrobium thiodismutans TaxID=1653476 RepID=A0A0U5B511_9BACT|nr:phosphate acyltransferase PlsX [Caldimicrobium thiodismutans]BAU23152.1 phosphate acyltransferase [Caldimicrobium thiodismutans]
MYRIVLDVMGGDYAPDAILKGAKLALSAFADLSLILTGPKDVLKNFPTSDRVEFVYTEEWIRMDEAPGEALKKKKGATIFKGLSILKEGKAQAFVSAGNSGAVVAGSIFILGRLTKVRRPAIATMLPTLKDPMVLIDAGANVDSKAYDLYQFGLMASLFLETIWGRKSPKVALLSIGEETGKGNQLVKETHNLFKTSHLNYYGNIEGKAIFKGDVDIVVCDGFIGNICLKLSEGLAETILEMLKNEVKKSYLYLFGMYLSKGALQAFKKKTDWREYGGAPLLGVKGNVIIAHGKSDPYAIKNAIRQALHFSKINLSEKLEKAILENALEEEKIGD